MSRAPLPEEDRSITSSDDAPQHRPRPLPLFLELLRSETAGSPDRMARALAGLRRYQQADRIAPPPPMPIVATVGRAMVRDYGGRGRPILFVPSLINPPSVLDIAPDRSLLRWLATQGFRPLLVDWGTPGLDDHSMDLADHVEALLIPLIRALDVPDLTMVGYCLGGMLALGAASTIPVAGLVLLATPWHFSGFPLSSRGGLADLWAQARPLSESLGLLPMEILQTAFWQLDPARVIAKYERLAGASDHALADFVRLEDWANTGPPLTHATARDLIEGCFTDDQTGRGEWHVAGSRVLPRRITAPILNIVSTSDRIVPARSAARAGDRQRIVSGHVGMVVGARAEQQLWQPLALWLSRLRKT